MKTRTPNLLATMGILFCTTMLLALAACEHRGGNNQPNPNEPNIEYKISVVSGSGQSGRIDAQLPAALKVFVTDINNIKQPGVIVYFKITEGFGALSASSQVTGSDGFCEIFLTPNNALGEIKVEAKVSGSDAYVEFTATAVP
jgi:hypothetical protein